MVRYIILLHDYEAHRTLYEGLISRLQEAGITAGLEGGEVDIVDLAEVPTKPAPLGTSPTTSVRFSPVCSLASFWPWSLKR